MMNTSSQIVFNQALPPIGVAGARGVLRMRTGRCAMAVLTNEQPLAWGTRILGTVGRLVALDCESSRHAQNVPGSQILPFGPMAMTNRWLSFA